MNSRTQFGRTQFGRTFICRWDMIAAVSLLVSSGAYGFYAITQMTGF